jgi:phage/plasmid-like protein (TIGR03299 family)
MAHELEMRDGQASMAYVGEVPWHGLGIQVPPNLTPSEFQVAAGLNWRVIKAPLYADTALGSIEIPGQCALVRDVDQKFISLVPEDWQETQNDEMFEFFDEFFARDEVEMSTGGSLFDGRMVWAMAKLKESFTVFGKDRIDGNLLFSMPHEYGKAIDIRLTPVRVVCNNTLTLALSSDTDTQFQVRKTHRTEFNADFAKMALGVATTKMAQYKEQAEFLGSRRCTDEQVNQYFSELFIGKNWNEPTAKGKPKTSRNMEIVQGLLHSQPGAEFAEGSWWQPFNAVTFYWDHMSQLDVNKRLDSIWYGQGKTKKHQALNLALDMAKVS